ncbi:MAG: hypothetical protein U0136_08235 [Bdellovibrionota bacterium]
MVEYAIFTAVIIGLVASTVLWAQQKSEDRLDTGRSLYQCEQLCDPRAPNCDC